jgi:hypothetical protein
MFPVLEYVDELTYSFCTKTINKVTLSQALCIALLAQSLLLLLLLLPSSYSRSTVAVS